MEEGLSPRLCATDADFATSSSANRDAHWTSNFSASTSSWGCWRFDVEEDWRRSRAKNDDGARSSRSLAVVVAMGLCFRWRRGESRDECGEQLTFVFYFLSPAGHVSLVVPRSSGEGQKAVVIASRTSLSDREKRNKNGYPLCIDRGKTVAVPPERCCSIPFRSENRALASIDCGWRSTFHCCAGQEFREARFPCRWSNLSVWQCSRLSSTSDGWAKRRKSLCIRNEFIFIVDIWRGKEAFMPVFQQLTKK